MMIKGFLFLICCVFVFAGCGSDSGHDSHHEDSSAPRVIVKDGEYSDKRFIDMMVPHHEMALDMANAAMEHSQDKQIKTLSEKMLRSQSNEIEELKRVRQDLYSSRETPKGMHQEAMDNMGMGDHNLSGHDLHGDDFDKEFLDMMLPHHAAAVSHASLVLVHSKNGLLRKMAREIIDEQSREIGMMGQWRVERWPHDYA